ncbi:SDR family NAD(P)-dependent oxidoreductase [Oceanibacterium hippocampi]|uniref:Gluconate 5-dehydrogenase n=1 Tax=Oceanibacterium hippocampi TaxID=745714 RepID=A0A1Y5TKC5_9PROT|nr:SDR family oxidoreductase [Oceanibacterium hippocampi]SLN63987.1 Gluconate 5-dehydrogenase [Oceanibacterium hippocampi]
MSGMLDGKVAWVVGAAGAIGAETCRRFAAEGASVVLSGRNEASLAEVADALPASARATVSVIDVTDRPQVDAAAADLIGKFGRIDILVNSTTCPIFAELDKLSDDDWMAVLDAKVLGYMRTARAVLPHMSKQGTGSIINVSGRGGHQPNSPSHLAGSCSNGAVNTLTKGLANIYGPRGIRVNAIAPGPVRSPRYEVIAAANRAIAAKSGNPERSGSSAANPLGEMSEVGDIADAALYLASGLSGFVTGIVLQVDGGGTASL